MILNWIGEFVDVRKCTINVWHSMKGDIFRHVRQCSLDFGLRAPTGETGVAIIEAWIEPMPVSCAVQIKHFLSIDEKLLAAAGNKTITDRRCDSLANFFEFISGAICCVMRRAPLLPVFSIWFLSLVSHTGIISCI